jgi:hypothetical protein
MALLVGCSSGGGDAANGDAGLPVDGAPDSDAGLSTLDQGPPGFRLLRMEPSQVPFRGSEVTVYYQGTPPPSITCPPQTPGQFCNLFLEVNGVQSQLACGLDPEVSSPCPSSAWKVYVPRGDDKVQNQPIVIVALGPPGELGRLDPAGSYLPPLPPTPSLQVQPAFDASGPDGFDLPLPPELARPCARRDFAYLSNTGDLPLDVNSVSLTGESAFTVEMDGCSGKNLLPFGFTDPSGVAANECSARLCFDSATPGSHGAMITIGTAAGAVSASLAATVTAASTGLDTSFASTGALPVSVYTHVRQTALPLRPSMTPSSQRRHVIRSPFQGSPPRLGSLPSDKLPVSQAHGEVEKIGSEKGSSRELSQGGGSGPVRPAEKFRSGLLVRGSIQGGGSSMHSIQLECYSQIDLRGVSGPLRARGVLHRTKQCRCRRASPACAGARWRHFGR